MEKYNDTGYYFVKLTELAFMDAEHTVFTADDFLWSVQEAAYKNREAAQKDADKYLGKVVELVLIEK
jgi:hypothetical protein